MHDISRRTLLSGAALAALAPALRPGAAIAADITPKRGGTLDTILTPEPPILVLGVNNQAPTQLAGGKIFQGLLTFSPTLEPIPVLAKSWTVSPDGKEYVFKLQEGVKFHDG